MFHEPEYQWHIITITGNHAKPPKALVKQIHCIGGQRDIGSILFWQVLVDRSHPELGYHVSPGAHLRGGPISIDAPDHSLPPFLYLAKNGSGSAGRHIFSINQEGYRSIARKVHLA